MDKISMKLIRKCARLLIETIRLPLKHKNLIVVLSKREISGRYKGSMFGLMWSLINPILMLLVYTFVFGVVFKSKWAGQSEGTGEFALILFSGLMPFNVFAECVNRAPTLVTSNANYVKRIIFPLEILPWVTIVAALFHYLVSMAVWILFYVFLKGIPKETMLLTPLVLIPLTFLTVGVSWMLASLGVYFRDVTQITSMIITIMLFTTPIFFPPDVLPESIRTIVSLNPMTHLVDFSRSLMVFGSTISFASYLKATLASLVIYMVGFIWFRATKKGFADVV